MTQSVHHLRALQEAARAKEAARAAVAAEAAAAVAKEAALAQQRREVAAAQASMGLGSMGGGMGGSMGGSMGGHGMGMSGGGMHGGGMAGMGMYGAAMMVAPQVNPYVASYGRMYGMPQPMPVQQPAWMPLSGRGGHGGHAHHGGGAYLAPAPGGVGASPPYATRTPRHNAHANVNANGGPNSHSLSNSLMSHASSMRSGRLEHDHAAFDVGAFPTPPAPPLVAVPGLNLRGGASAAGLSSPSVYATEPSGPPPAFMPQQHQQMGASPGYSYGGGGSGRGGYG